jgi:hypothetical protein
MAIARGTLMIVTNDWNIAIEAAAVVADDYAKRAWSARFPSQAAAVAAEHIAKSIRKLKVDEVDMVNPPIIGGAGDEALSPPTETSNCADALQDQETTRRLRVHRSTRRR